MNEGKPKIGSAEEWITEDLGDTPYWQLVTWAQELLDGERHETNTGLPYTIHRKPGTPEHDRNRLALATLLASNAVPKDVLVKLAIAIAPQTQGSAYPIAKFVHSKANRHDVVRDSFLANSVYELVQKGKSVEEACHLVSERYGTVSARTVHQIWKRYKPARDRGLLWAP